MSAGVTSRIAKSAATRGRFASRVTARSYTWTSAAPTEANKRGRMHGFMLQLGFVVALFATGACAQRPETPLTQAAVRNDVAALRQLLHNVHKADERDSWTPLIWASRSGSIDAMSVLLDSGADVNLPGPTGDNWDATPLQHAILERQPAAV